MKKLFYLLIFVTILCGIYLFVSRSGKLAQESLFVSKAESQHCSHQIELLHKLSKMKNWQAYLAVFQRVERPPDGKNIQKIFKDMAVKYHVSIVEWNKHRDVYELSLLADLDTDVCEFWQACARQLPGQIYPITYGLYRSSKVLGKVQGRIRFINVLEPKERQ